MEFQASLYYHFPDMLEKSRDVMTS